MPETTYRGRRAHQIASGELRVTVLVEGGHIAEVCDLASGVSPLWTPPWPSIEPSTYDPERHPEYGRDAESRLLAGIMGHNLCLDVFGGPSPEEEAAGIGVHGESSVAAYAIESTGAALTAAADLPLAGLRVARRIEVRGRAARVEETVENLGATDRPIAWTQHVTLGPPFLRKASTRFEATATRSKTIEWDFTSGKGSHAIGAEFDWPMVPTREGGRLDLRTLPDVPVSGAYTTHLMDPAREQAWFCAWSPEDSLAFGYVWRRADFPWLGIWEENHSRAAPPWNGATLTRGMEFGVSPMPESRRQMIDRGSLFGVPGYRWLPAKSQASVVYTIFLQPANEMPRGVEWDGGFRAVTI